MIPSRRWFPGNFSARADWFDNFYTQFAAVAASLGFDADDITAVRNDNQVMQFLADVFTQAKAFDDAARQYRKIITEDDTGKPTPEFPANPAFALPVVVPTGIYERLDKLVDRIKVTPNYTDETGALLGIIPTQEGDVPELDVKPTIKAFSAAMGHHFSLVVEGREKATTWNALIKRDGSDKWELAKTASGKSVDITVELIAAGKPEQIQVIVQLQKSNADYGQPSDPVYVTLNP